MHKMLLTFCIIILGLSITAYPQDKSSVKNKETTSSEYEGKIRELFEDITLLNLVNGLNLNEAQIKQIIQYNKKVQLLRDQMQDENNKTIKDIVDAFATLKSTLEKNEGIPQEIENRAFTMEQEGKKVTGELMNAVANIEKELTGILLDAQKEIINTFNPCLIPPKDLKNPVRAGQAQNNEMAVELLRHLRRVPDEVFEERKSEIAQRHLEMIQKRLGKLTDEEKERESQRLLKVIEKVRAMTDKEFELNGPGLANEFMNESKKDLSRDKDLREEIEQIERIRHGGPSRLGRYLLNPKIIPILEKRLEIMKNPRKIAPADLDKINTNPK
ncbi:MAG: hypothetical protein V1871_08785 [Planctomycetota bacterium]